jgi:MarR family transcriptional regulator for hemolysin
MGDVVMTERPAPVSNASPPRFGSLIGLTARQWRRAVDSRLQPFDLTEATWVPLLTLTRSQKPLRQKDLAAALSLDSSSVVRILKTLEANGLVNRGQDGVDGRAKAILITPKGRALAARVEHVSRDLEAELLAAIPDDHIAIARCVLEAIGLQLSRPNTLDLAA